MCMLESELENQLGEFHVKMKGEKILSPYPPHPLIPFSSPPFALHLSSKRPQVCCGACLVCECVWALCVGNRCLWVAGLAGFARLCAGDQYEVSCLISFISLPLPSVSLLFSHLSCALHCLIPWETLWVFSIRVDDKESFMWGDSQLSWTCNI